MTFEEMSKTYIYLRSIKQLMQRSQEVQHQLKNQYSTWSNINETLEHLFSINGFQSILDIKKITHSLTNKGLGPETTYAQKKQILNISRRKKHITNIIKKAQDYLKEGGKKTRASQWQWRLEQAIRQATDDGWFPLFGTYTVDPKALPQDCLTRDDLWRNTPAWDRFVKKFKTEIADSLGYGRKPSKWPLGHTFFQYFAVVEHGASGEHPHIHVIWLCKNIPDSWKKDPNNNCSTNTLTDIIPASSLWSHGIQRQTMALFIVGSWFTNNWVIPIKKDTLKPGKIGDAGAVAGYIGKYLTKGETKKWNHRVKATKNLGIQKLIHNIQKEKSIQLLLAMATRPGQYKTWMKIQTSTPVPMSLLREKSKKELMRRLHSMKTQRARNFLREEWTKKPSKFYGDFIKTVKDGLRPWKMMPEQRYNEYTLIMGAPASTVLSEKRISKLIQWLCDNQSEIKHCGTFTLLKGES